MRIFMLGWEFPPHISGGLGTACYGLTRGLSDIGVEVSFVLPTAVPVEQDSHVSLKGPSHVGEARRQVARKSSGSPKTSDGRYAPAEGVELHQVPAVLQPYATPETFRDVLLTLTSEERHELGLPEPDEFPGLIEEGGTQVPQSPASGAFVAGAGMNYGGDLMSQVYRYARMAVELARAETFDAIHAHDWMTYPAGAAVAAATGKPLVIHIHSTEFDRSGDNVNQQVYEIERMGMHAADRVVCVSHLTRQIAISRYGVPAEKTTVIYNAVNLPDTPNWLTTPIRQDEKIVLFLGRVTMQKGPEYFLQAAKRVVEKYPNVRFIMAGSGDMVRRCIEMCANLKIGSHVTFTGFLRGHDVDRVFQMADLYVMPSVSEPFGIAPLEALSHNVPVIISKQSGVSEVLTHALKVDFWDIDEIANKILAVLRHAPLQKTLRQHGQIELRKLSWRDSALQLKEIYTDLSK